MLHRVDALLRQAVEGNDADLPDLGKGIFGLAQASNLEIGPLTVRTRRPEGASVEPVALAAKDQRAGVNLRCRTRQGAYAGGEKSGNKAR